MHCNTIQCSGLACINAAKDQRKHLEPGYKDIYCADRTCCCQSPFLSLQLLAALTASLVSYSVVTLRISHNEFHCGTSFSHPFCLELLLVVPIIL